MEKEKRFVGFVDNNVLICPDCGGEHLHHKWIRNYFRKDGENKEGKVIEIKEDNVRDLTFVEYDNNPSERRNGIRIGFWCENCLAHVELLFAQHKGQTIINMEFVSDAYALQANIDYMPDGRQE